MAEFARREKRNLAGAGSVKPVVIPPAGRLRPSLVEIDLRDVTSAGIWPAVFTLDITQGTATDKRLREASQARMHPESYRASIRFVKRCSPRGDIRWAEKRSYDKEAYLKA